MQHNCFSNISKSTGILLVNLQKNLKEEHVFHHYCSQLQTRCLWFPVLKDIEIVQFIYIDATFMHNGGSRNLKTGGRGKVFEV